MDTLPDELLGEIFSYIDLKSLSTYTEVCKRWSKIVMGTAGLNSRLAVEEESDLTFLKDWPNSQWIKTIYVRLEVDSVGNLLRDLQEFCPYLLSLTMDRCNVLNEFHLCQLSESFPHLEHIDIFLTSHFVSQNFLKVLTPMKIIVLNNHIDDKSLRAIAQNCNNIKELHMYGFVQFFPLYHLHNLLNMRYNQLTKLTLRCYEVTDKTCQIIAQCVSLRHLCLYHCWLITDNGLTHLKGLQFLRALHLTGPKLITKSGFAQYLEDCVLESVMDLNMSSSLFNDQHAAIVGKKMVNLKTLELWNCKQLSSVGIGHLVRGCKRLFVVDLNMSLSEDVLTKIVFESDVKYLTYDHAIIPLIVPENRNLDIRPAFRCYDEFYFRGNSEGFRANVFCYSYQYQLPYSANTSLDSSS